MPSARPVIALATAASLAAPVLPARFVPPARFVLPAASVPVVTSVLLAALVLLAPIGIGKAVADDAVFQHRGEDGVVSFSDHPAAARGTPRTSYRTDFGRATATASCTGLNAAALDARGELRREAIHDAAHRHALEPELLMALVRVESCFDARARSRAGAVGLTQLMPATALALGVRDRLDAAANLDAGARYLARMLARFGEVRLALAAYNAGPGNVERHGGVPPFRETTSYLRRVLAARERYRGLVTG